MKEAPENVPNRNRARHSAADKLKPVILRRNYGIT